MTLTQLEYIVALDRFRHFTEAAEHTFVSQPALTTQVKKLEEELGVVLFDRSRKPLVPTEIGQQVVEQARHILQESEKVAELVLQHQGEIGGELRLGVIPTVAPYLVPRFVDAFLKEHPKVLMGISEHYTEDIIDAIKLGDMDAGVIVTPVEVGGITTVPLYYERFYAYVSAAHPLYKRKQLSSKDLKDYPVWLLKEGNCFRNQVVNICGRKRNEMGEALHYESSSIESLKRIVQSQQGITLIPELAVEKADEKMIKTITNPVPYREVSLVVSRTFLKKRLLDQLAESIRASVPQSMLRPIKELVETGV